MNEYDDPIVKEIKNAAYFPIDVECEAFPDVIFEIVFERRVEPFMIEDSVHALEEYMDSYNRIHFFRPIHYVSDTDSLPEATSVFSVCVHMDFGNASPKALIGAVKALANTKLPIYRLILQ